MYDLRVAANLYRVERAYRRPKLERRTQACKLEETDAMWGRESFLRQERYN
ncbi:hypothetical protein ACFL3V_04640 [Nanoarchaeota archaeon]